MISWVSKNFTIFHTNVFKYFSSCIIPSKSPIQSFYPKVVKILRSEEKDMKKVVQEVDTLHKSGFILPPFVYNDIARRCCLRNDLSSIYGMIQSTLSNPLFSLVENNHNSSPISSTISSTNLPSSQNIVNSILETVSLHSFRHKPEGILKLLNELEMENDINFEMNVNSLYWSLLFNPSTYNNNTLNMKKKKKGDYYQNSFSHPNNNGDDIGMKRFFGKMKLSKPMKNWVDNNIESHIHTSSSLFSIFLSKNTPPLITKRSQQNDNNDNSKMIKSTQEVIDFIEEKKRGTKDKGFSLSNIELNHLIKYLISCSLSIQNHHQLTSDHHHKEEEGENIEWRMIKKYFKELKDQSFFLNNTQKDAFNLSVPFLSFTSQEEEKEREEEGRKEKRKMLLNPQLVDSFVRISSFLSSSLSNDDVNLEKLNEFWEEHSDILREMSHNRKIVSKLVQKLNPVKSSRSSSSSKNDLFTLRNELLDSFENEFHASKEDDGEVDDDENLKEEVTITNLKDRKEDEECQLLGVNDEENLHQESVQEEKEEEVEEVKDFDQSLMTFLTEEKDLISLTLFDKLKEEYQV